MNTSIVENPNVVYYNSFYVDALNGDNSNDGLTEETAFATIKKACQTVPATSTIFVKSGTYNNDNFGSGDLNLFPVCTLNGKSDIKITNFDGHSPVIEFDGNSAFQIASGLRLEISGFEIKGSGGVC